MIAEAEDDLLIDPDSFKSFELEVKLTNLTTSTEISNIKEENTKKDWQIWKRKAVTTLQVVEVSEQGVVLEVPPHSGAKGHEIFLDLNVKGTAEPITFEAKCKIVEIEAVDGGVFRANVEFQDFDYDSWGELLGLYSKRQEEILDFFKAARGY